MTIKESRLWLPILSAAGVYLIYELATDWPSQSKNQVILYLSVAGLLLILLVRIRELVSGKFFLKVSAKGLSTPSDFIPWQQVSFVLLAAYSKKQSVLIMKTDADQPQEIDATRANHRLKRIGHLLYMYRKRSEEGPERNRKV